MIDSKALGYIDMTIYANESMPAVKWRSDEVVAMLREIREYLVEDFDALPGMAGVGRASEGSGTADTRPTSRDVFG